MTRRTKVRAVSYLTALIIALTVTCCVQTRRANHAEYLLEASYQRALGNLHSAMEQLTATLNKGQYVTSPELLTALAGELSVKSAQISTAIGELPYRDGNILKTAKFIAQVGDYAYSVSLNQNVQASQTFSELSKTAQQLLPEISRLYANMNIKRTKEAASENFAVTMERLEQEFPEYPMLVYDGPFSEHLQDREPVMLSGSGEINEIQARKIAADFLGVRFEMTACSVQNGGKIPTYTVYCGDKSVDITKNGGKVKLMLSHREVKNAKISDDNALKIAREYLAKHGYANMRESYHTRYQNTIMIDFNALQDGVRLYPDLVKVTVALDDGSVVNFESTGYLMNHKKRDLPEVKVSEEQVISQIPKTLLVKEISLALIPTGGENEILTYEVVCENENGEHILIYYDVRDGRQIKILILVEDENGTLTM